MYQRENFEPRPDRAPYFWVDTPIGRLCFARPLPSLGLAWRKELSEHQAEAGRLIESVQETDGGAEEIQKAQALQDASLGLFIARHWVDEAIVMESVQRFRRGEFHPSKPWPEHYPDLDGGSLRYGWSAAAEFGEWGVTQVELIDLATKVAAGPNLIPDPDDVEDAVNFSDPPQASGISA